MSCGAVKYDVRKDGNTVMEISGYIGLVALDSGECVTSSSCRYINYRLNIKKHKNCNTHNDGNDDCETYIYADAYANLNVHSHREHIAAKLIKNSSIDL